MTLGEVLVYVIPILLGVGVFFLCRYMEVDLAIDIVTFYADKMRGSIFTGFLTLGSFLLALKTGILIKIKEGVYDKEDYQKKVREPGLLGISTVYGPLRRLSRLMSIAVLSALITSSLQLTLGLISDWRATAACLSIASFSISVLIASFISIQFNLGIWFDLMEDNVSNAEKKECVCNTKKRSD